MTRRLSWKTLGREKEKKNKVRIYDEYIHIAEKFVKVMEADIINVKGIPFNSFLYANKLYLIESFS